MCLKEYQSIFSARRTNLTKSSNKTHFARLDLAARRVNKSPAEWEIKTDGLGLYAHAPFNVAADVPHNFTTNNILYQYVQPWLVQYFNVTAR